MTMPDFNAACNLTSATLLAVGFVMIRKRRMSAHRACMLGALAASVVFLVGYVTYHALNPGVTRFQGPPGIRAVYLVILGTHTVLAMVVVPLVIVTLLRALRARFERHRGIARVTLPLWFYVSVTGVLVYLMLYRWFPSAERTQSLKLVGPPQGRTLIARPLPAASPRMR